MNEGLRRLAYSIKSALFTIIIHGLVLAALLAGLWWPFSETRVSGEQVQPVQAVVISEQEVQEAVERQKREKEAEKLKAQRELEELKKQQEEERKRLEQLELARQKEEQEQQKLEQERQLAEQKRQQEEQRKKEEAEKKRKQEEQRKKEEAEKKRKQEEAERKRREEEKRKQEAERKRQEEEKRKREEAERKRQQEAEAALRRKLDQEATLRAEAGHALMALYNQIRTAVESDWRRTGGQSGLKVTIRVQVAPNGEVLSANVVKSSGDPLFDQSGVVAIQKASPLPFPADPRYYEYIKEFNFEFAPDD